MYQYQGSRNSDREADTRRSSAGVRTEYPGQVCRVYLYSLACVSCIVGVIGAEVEFAKRERERETERERERERENIVWSFAGDEMDISQRRFFSRRSV